MNESLITPKSLNYVPQKRSPSRPKLGSPNKLTQSKVKVPMRPNLGIRIKTRYVGGNPNDDR
jgi:hypothetical protein